MNVAGNCCINCKYGFDPINSDRCAPCVPDDVQWSNWESDEAPKEKRRYVIENRNGELWCTAAAYDSPPIHLGVHVVGVLEREEGDDAWME